MCWSPEQIWHKTHFLLNNDFLSPVLLLERWGFTSQPLLIVVSLVLFFFFLPTLQAQESLASLEREIGKVVGDANVIENSDVRTDSVSVSLETVLRGSTNLVLRVNFGKLCLG